MVLSQNITIVFKFSDHIDLNIISFSNHNHHDMAFAQIVIADNVFHLTSMTRIKDICPIYNNELFCHTLLSPCYFLSTYYVPTKEIKNQAVRCNFSIYINILSTVLQKYNKRHANAYFPRANSSLSVAVSALKLSTVCVCSLYYEIYDSQQRRVFHAY